MKFAKCALGALLLLPIVSLAQTTPGLKWNEDQLSWTAPTQCADGSPIGDCPVTGFRVETATSTTGTWTTVATIGPVISHKVTGVSAGQHCYRVFALSNALVSAPSNTSCATATGPAPGAPVLKTVDQVAWDVKRRYFGLFGPYELNARVGTVDLGTECTRESVEGHNGVNRSDVTFTRPPRSKLVVARCA